MKNFILYALKIWVSGVIIGPLLYLVILQLGSALNTSSEDLLFTFLVYLSIAGIVLMFSLPTFVFLVLLVHFIYKNPKFKSKSKRLAAILIFTEIAILLNFLVGITLASGYEPIVWGQISLYFGLILAAGVYFYKIKEPAPVDVGIN